MCVLYIIGYVTYCTYQLYAPLPPSRAMVGNEGDVLLQNMAPVVRRLAMPIFYRRIKIYGYLPHGV